MSDHNDSVAFGVDTAEFVHNEGGRVGVEVPGRFVSEDDFWLGDYSAGDGGALLLPARELERAIVFFFL